jgi:hypothetical protein
LEHVQLPIIEQPIKTNDNLMLGPTDALSAEISDAILSLQNMLAIPFV